jgi:hypothetical protein
VLREFDVDRNAAALADRIRRSSGGSPGPAGDPATIGDHAQEPAA